MKKGVLIGRGRNARIYKWGDNEIVKLFEKGTDTKTVEKEFIISKIVYKTGIDTPYAREIVEIEGQLGIIYEYIAGSTMLRLLFRRFYNLRSYAQTLARLQAELHKNKCSELPDIKSKLTELILKASSLSDDKKHDVLSILNELPSGDIICHFDLHPDNIIKSKKGYTIIDWTNAVSGCAAADVAITSMALVIAAMPPGKKKIEVFAANIARKKFNYEYIKEYIKVSGLSIDDIKAWEIPVLAARLSSNVPGEKGIITARLDKLLDEKKQTARS